MKSFILAAALLLGASAQAKVAQCVLVVDGRTYLNGDCNFDAHSNDGSFSIGTGAKFSYFAYVLVSDGKAMGYWNGVDRASHAHTNLGVLERNGACWTNSRAVVCAWAK